MIVINKVVSFQSEVSMAKDCLKRCPPSDCCINTYYRSKERKLKKIV